MASLRRAPSIPLCDRDPSDPSRRAVELAQRGRMILDVCTADLETAEAVHGPFHPIAWHFRNARDEARRSWDRLRAEFGGPALDAALAEPPLTILVLRGPEPEARETRAEPPAGREPCGSVLLVPISGQTYRAERVEGTPLAPILWRLTRLHPPLEDGPYYACRLQDGSTQCDCAEWTYQIAGTDRQGRAHCKHLAALAALGWI
jgi:hypothetical protein